MKTTDIFILIATAAYSFLFYKQSPGLNFLLFNLLIVSLFLSTNKTLVRRTSWFAAATGAILSAFCIFWWGTTLPVLANICSLFMLAGLSFNPQSSLLVAAFNTFISTATSIPRFFQG